jgi:hypothetical protein
MVEAEDSMAAAVSAVRRGIQFWVAVMLTGVGTGVSAGALYMLLPWIQHTAWPGDGSVFEVISHASLFRHCWPATAVQAYRVGTESISTRPLVSC